MWLKTFAMCLAKARAFFDVCLAHIPCGVLSGEGDFLIFVAK
jgi:hypothetical protein